MIADDLKSLQPNTPVYFGYSAMEFIGRVREVSGDVVSVLGVETGCETKECHIVVVARISSLHRVTEDEFARLTQNEPAFQNCKEQEQST